MTHSFRNRLLLVPASALVLLAGKLSSVAERVTIGGLRLGMSQYAVGELATRSEWQFPSYSDERTGDVLQLQREATSTPGQGVVRFTTTKVPGASALLFFRDTTLINFDLSSSSVETDHANDLRDVLNALIAELVSQLGKPQRASYGIEIASIPRLRIERGDRESIARWGKQREGDVPVDVYVSRDDDGDYTCGVEITDVDAMKQWREERRYGK